MYRVEYSIEYRCIIIILCVCIVQCQEKTGFTRCWQMASVECSSVQCTQSVMTVNSLARLLLCLLTETKGNLAEFSHSPHQRGSGLCKPVSKQRCNLISFCQIFSKNHIIAHIFGHLSLTKWMQNRGTVTSAPSRSQLNVINDGMFAWYVVLQATLTS